MSARPSDRHRLTVAAVHVLTAAYSVANGISLTSEDVVAIEREGSRIDPGAWRRTTELLEHADWGGPGRGLAVALRSFVLRWLGLADEGEFVAAFGCGIAEALEGCRGRLAELAHAVESVGGSEEGRYLVTLAWSRRAALLNSGLPDTAPAAIEAIDKALEHCPASHGHRLSLHAALALASDARGDVVGAERARGRLVGAVVAGELGGDRASDLAVSALVLSVLFAIADDELLLRSERWLDPEIEPGPETWDRVRAAVASGRIEDVPLPARTLDAWTSDAAVVEGELGVRLEACADRLPEVVRVVELLWGRPGVDDDAELGIAYWVQTAAWVRWVALKDGYRPLAGEPDRIWLEAHQGAARPETMERVRIVRRVREVFRRVVGVQPTSLMEVYLDRADEQEARGEHDLALAEIESALEIARGASHDAAWWRPAELRLVRWLLASGEVGEARELLGRLYGPDTAELRAAIEEKVAEREALAGALDAWERDPDPGTGARLAHAHLVAGHWIAAERSARDVCRRFPAEPVGWRTLAEVLEVVGRYRDARSAMVTALERGFDERQGRAFLERMSARTGS